MVMDVHRVLGGLIRDQHCCRLWHSATHDMACSSRRVRTGRRLPVLPLLGLEQLGRWDIRRRHIASCTAACMHGSSTVHRLRVRVATLTHTLACVTGFGSGHGAVRVPLHDRSFGPCGS